MAVIEKLYLCDGVDCQFYNEDDNNDQWYNIIIIIQITSTQFHILSNYYNSEDGRMTNKYAQ